MSEFTDGTDICNTRYARIIEHHPSEHTPPVQEGAKWVLLCLLPLVRRPSEAPNRGWTFLMISGRSLAKSNVGCFAQGDISLCQCPWIIIPALGYRDTEVVSFSSLGKKNKTNW